VPIDFGFEGPATIDFGFDGPEQPKKKQPDWRDAEAASNLEAMQGPRPQDPGDMEVRGNILPISRNVETGKRSAAIPGFIQDPLMLPGDVYTGKVDPNSDEGIQRALGFAGGVTLASKFGGAPKQTPITQSRGMPRASVRDEAELLKTGGARLKEAKKSEATVPLDDVQAPMQRFRERLNEEALEIDPQYTNKKLANVVKRLDTAYAAPKTDPMSRLTKTAPAAKPPMTLKELHAHQRRLDDVISESKSADGRISTDGYIAIELKKSVGEMIDAHPESSSFKIGKHEYHRGKMSQSMTDLKKRAEGRVQWRNGDEAGALQSEIQNFLRNKKNRYALTPEVRRKLDQLSRDNRGKVIGAFSPQSSFGGNVFARGIETAIGFPGALAVPGHFARQGRNSRLIKEFENLMEELRAGGPVR
jgi:hypothetical protein